MDMLALAFVIISSVLFVIFVLFSFSILGLWLSEIGLWIISFPLFMIVVSFIKLIRDYALPTNRFDIIILVITIVFNIVIFLRIIIPLSKIRKTNILLQRKMEQSLGKNYLLYVDFFSNSDFYKEVRFQFLHYFLGVNKHALDKKVVSIRDLTYHKTNDKELKLNVYYPQKRGYYPTILFIHGGGFIVGSKDQPKQEKICQYLANYGYCVFNVDYHLTPLSYLVSKDKAIKNDLLICDMVTDIRKAIVFAKEHAVKYSGNPKEFFVFGRSAGGHLALLSAYSCLGKIYNLSNCDGQIKEHEINGVIAFYPVTDFSALYEHYGKQNLVKFLMTRGIGGSPEELQYFYQVFSPINYVSEKYSQSIPPTFLVTGERDRLVTPEQSRKLYNRLQQIGVDSVLLELPWANHAFDTILNGPGGQLTIKYLIQFLVWVITKIRFKEIAELAQKYGLAKVIPIEKYQTIHELKKFDFSKIDEEAYNKPFFEHLYQLYGPNDLN
ncbi:MAG: alpha/beta hydrolase [Candidatus Heimdallarchaeota archaeon]|nr:alpha/beta hydrolase [Candidatus Heimdallarchaeota archaeon]